MASDTYYSVPDAFDTNDLNVWELETDFEKHPEIELSKQRITEAEANFRAARAELLPDFNLQGGLQKVNDVDGFYSYQAVITVPLLSGTERSRAKAAKINGEIAKANADFTQNQLRLEYGQAVRSYRKWSASWQLYEQKALPLSEEQRKGALLAYTKGAVDYAAFTQIIRDAIQTEIDAFEALDNYPLSVFELQYFKK